VVEKKTKRRFGGEDLEANGWTRALAHFDILVLQAGVCGHHRHLNSIRKFQV
jgi:hypothetical protein